MRYKLAIFDMDGTILDTLDDLTDSLNFALESLGFQKRTKNEVKSFVGNGIRKLVERGAAPSASAEQVDAVFKTFTEHYRLHCTDKTKEYCGISELLKTLRKLGIKTAVVSNKADFAVQELCMRYFSGLFDAAVGEKAGVRKKPAPDSVNEVLKALCVKKENAVYIGDSDVDIETAKNAGLDCISVSWGFRDEKILLKSGATVITGSTKGLLELITKD